jgi:hypothetical protein
MLKGELATALGGSTEMITSVMENYVLIILAFPIAILLSLIVILFIRLTASCFIYLLIFATIVALILFGVYLFMMPSLAEPGEEPLINDNTTRILVGIAVLLLAVLITIMVCCVRKRLSLASSIIKVSATFVTANCSIVFLPILLFVIMVLFVALWILEALGYYSLGTPTNAEHKYPFQQFDVPSWIVAVGIFHIFYLLWNLVFFIETGSFIIGGAATSWYFKRATPYADASARYRKKHIGSVVLGSFFMALFGFLKFLYELVTPEQKEGEKGLLAAYKKCCDCVCCLCTKLFHWFNNGAFTVINLKGDSYCTAAERAFAVRIQNIGTSAVVDIVTAVRIHLCSFSPFLSELVSLSSQFWLSTLSLNTFPALRTVSRTSPSFS